SRIDLSVKVGRSGELNVETWIVECKVGPKILWDCREERIQDEATCEVGTCMTLPNDACCAPHVDVGFTKKSPPIPRHLRFLIVVASDCRRFSRERNEDSRKRSSRTSEFHFYCGRRAFLQDRDFRDGVISQVKQFEQRSF